jgi:hypothetical protein
MGCTFQTAIWFWMTKHDGRASSIHNALVEQNDGFASTTFIINGGLECGATPSNIQSEKKRIENYKKLCATFGVTDLAIPLTCQTAGYAPGATSGGSGSATSTTATNATKATTTTAIESLSVSNTNLNNRCGKSS